VINFKDNLEKGRNKQKSLSGTTLNESNRKINKTS